MGSPFKTADDYLNATGTLHSFTGHPGTAAVFLAISAGLTVFFLIKSFTMHH
jgi:hypothetical protein